MAPKTIQEFLDFARQNCIPLEKIRFFIGQNCLEPKCFGIYQEGDRFIVYKNKSDGSRAVRYHGPDEAEACRILYEKLCDEAQLRRNTAAQKGAQPRKKNNRMVWFFVIAIMIMITFSIIGGDKHRQGYYTYDDFVLYCLSDTFYYLDDGDWYPYEYDMDDGIDDYYYGESYDFDDPNYDFDNTSYYEDWQESGGDVSDTDWGSWDSSDTNWDSDW